jgi:hypothetical protein
MPSAASTIAAVGRRSIGTAFDLARPRVEPGAAIELSFSGWMFGDVGHPQLVRTLTTEIAIHHIDRRFTVDQIRFAFPPCRKPRASRLRHDRLNQLLVDAISVRIIELGTNAPPPIRTTRPRVDLPDHIREPRPTDRPIRRRGAAPAEESRRSDAQQPAHTFGATTFTSQHFHDTEQCFGAHHPALGEQLRRPSHRRQLGLELGDPSARGPRRGGFGGRRAREFAPVDTILANPPIHRRFRNVDRRGDLGDTRSRTNLLDEHRPGTATHTRAASHPPDSRNVASLATRVQESGDRSAGPLNRDPSRADERASAAQQYKHRDRRARGAGRRHQIRWKVPVRLDRSRSLLSFERAPQQPRSADTQRH